MTEQLFGCIEAGGTKFLVGIVAGPDRILDTVRIDTTTPEQTISASIAWLREAQSRHGRLAGIGIASFGPAELDRDATNWGYITQTTKPGWSNTDFANRVGHELELPVGFDTDVNGAALAESRWGASVGQKTSIYVTVGTGIGGGAIVDGRTLHGLSHPEMGHFRPQRHVDDFGFEGVCPFHGDCMEGLASGPAIKARWGASLSDLADDHPAHRIIGFYLAQMVVTLQSIMEPGRIILGGGVMATPGLLAHVQETAATLGAGYFKGQASDIVVLPGLGGRAGLIGALALAQDAAKTIGD
jgi:fructokinase